MMRLGMRDVGGSYVTRVARWGALVVCLALAVLYLNSAAYSAWAGAGPPTTIRDAWMDRALAHLCYAAAAVLGGFTLFRVTRRPPRLDRSALALLVLSVVFIAAPHARRFLLVDRCLDSGGRWDAAAFRCRR
jgi:hypothetical protein